jgi:hypothetical protein
MQIVYRYRAPQISSTLLDQVSPLPSLMASSSSVTALAAALGAPPTQLLTRENALVWKALVVNALRGARFLELVEGSEEAPDEHLETKHIDKKEVTCDAPKLEPCSSDPA